MPCPAQDTVSGPAINESDELIEEILVTGTRIKRKNMISTSPITQVNAEELLYQGSTRVEDLLAAVRRPYRMAILRTSGC